MASDAPLERRTALWQPRAATFDGTFLLVIGCVVAFTGYLVVGGEARLSANPQFPAPSTAGATALLRLSIILALGAGLSATLRNGTAVRPAFRWSLVILSLFVAGMEVFLWTGDPWSKMIPIAASLLVLLLFPSTWAYLSDRQIALALTPLVCLCALSDVTSILYDEYLFPWYNRWGLIAIVVCAAAVCLRSISARLRLTALGVAILGMVLSDSRQALIGLCLLAGVWLSQGSGFNTRIKRIAGALIMLVLVFSVISGSERVESVGGITGSNGRSALLSSGWDVVRESPIYGLAEDKPNSSLPLALKDVGLGWSKSVHNFVLDSWLRGGLPGAVSAIVFILSIVWSRRRRGALTGLPLLPFFLLGSELLFVEDTSAAVIIAIAYGIGLSGSPSEHSVGRRSRSQFQVSKAAEV